MSSPSKAEAGLGRDGLEALFPALADYVDRTPPTARERFLTKAFLLLADAGGNLDLAMRCLKEAQSSTVSEGRGTI